MTWLTLLKSVLSVANGLIRFMGDRQLIEAGEAKNAMAALKKAQTHVEKAKAAQDRIDSDPDYRDRVRKRFTRDG